MLQVHSGYGSQRTSRLKRRRNKHVSDHPTSCCARVRLCVGVEKGTGNRDPPSRIYSKVGRPVSSCAMVHIVREMTESHTVFNVDASVTFALQILDSKRKTFPTMTVLDISEEHHGASYLPSLFPYILVVRDASRTFASRSRRSVWHYAPVPSKILESIQHALYNKIPAVATEYVLPSVVAGTKPSPRPGLEYLHILDLRSSNTKIEYDKFDLEG